jgi:geranylgeranyl diphosphate synthase type II
MLTSTKKLAGLISSRLDNERFGREPDELYEPIRYILSIGGKRMRPMLTLLGYSLFKDDIEKAIEPALAVELFHNFTLMHDDIMDQAPLRRGFPTVHEKWNQHTAILSGDVMMLKAYEKLLKTETDLLRPVLEKFNKCAVEVCEGQQKDMLFEEREHVTEEEYLGMIRQKTAVLLGFSLELGALLAKADDKDLHHIRLFGESLGIGFQLKDDLLDVYGDAEKFGKQPGGDILANKKTYLLIKALELSTAKENEKLNQWLIKADYDPEEKLEAVKESYDKAGIVKITDEKITRYYNKALGHLNAIKAPLYKKSQLKQLALRLIEREK